MYQNLKTAAKNSVIYGLGNISSKLVGFILLPLYTTHLSVADYGVLGLLEVTSLAIVTLVGLRLYTAFFRWYWDKEYKEKQKSLFFSTIITLGFVSLVFYSGVVYSSNTLSELMFNDTSYSQIIKLMGLAAAFQIVIQMPLTLLRLQEKALLYSLLNTTKLVITLLLTVYLIAYRQMGIEGIYIAQIIGQISFLLISLPYILKNIQVRYEYRVIKGMIVYSYPLVLASIAGILLSIIDRYLLNFFGSLSNVGIYSLGYKIANTVQVFIVTSFQLALTPMMFKLMHDPNNKQFYGKILTYLALIVMFFVVLVSLFSQELIIMLAKDKMYWPAYQVVPIISMSIFFGMLRYQTQIGLTLVKKTSAISKITVVTSILNILLNLILIPAFSILGAATASLITQLCFWILIHTSSQKHYYIPYEIRKIIFLSVIGFVFIGMVFILQSYAWTIRLAVKSVLLISFPVILYGFNFFERKELQKLMEVLRIKNFDGPNVGRE